jgi:predicted DNA-binding transcriptional regulator YafY
MPVNKNAQLRYKVLDRCFRNKGRNFGINDLINEINKELEDLYGQDVQVSRRTVYDDIKYMKSDQGYSIPLKPYRDGQKVYMRYEDTNFSIYNQKLTDIEKRIILNATDVISRASGLQPFEDFQDILPKLKDAIDIKTTSQISISFEANLDLKGKEYFKIISEAINKKQILDINYKDFKSEEPYKLIFHPYYLKQYNDRWFAFGLNEATQISTWNVPLDRIEKIEYVNTKYIPSDTDWYEYFYDIVGVTRLNKKVEEVV